MKEGLYLFCFFITSNAVFSQITSKELKDKAINYSYLKNYKKAIECYSEIVKINPKDSTAYIERALLKQLTLDYKGAISDFTEGGKINPNEVDYFFFKRNA